MTIAVIDDDLQTLALVAAGLKQKDLEIITVDDPVKGLEIVRSRRPQVVLLDLMMPGLGGLEVLDQIVAIDPAIDVILMTAHYSTESAVQAIQKGACDYFNKPISMERLRERISQLIEGAERRAKAQKLEEELLEACRFQGIIGRSPLMLEVFGRIRRVAPHFRSVLLTGASGTGKELAAKALHHLSPAAAGPFVVCNCAALPQELIESELFGYAKGAFTGATSDKAGMFEFASGGTLLLDEIGEMPLMAQAKLLRAVQNQEIQRVGSPAPRKVNVRIIAATNRNLRELVAGNRFREDLFFRLSMVEIQLPGLVERKEDLPLLVRHFIEEFAHMYGKPIDGLTHRAAVVLSRYPWPGNIRELENAIGYACMMADAGSIDVHHLPEALRAGVPAAIRGSVELVSIDEIQRTHARRVVDYFGGNKARAAEVLGVSRATLYRFLSGAHAKTQHAGGSES
jgi:DNA-binding NtrC family response regulator